MLLLSGAIGFAIDAVPLLYDLGPMAGEASWFILAAILYFYLTKLFAGNLKHIVPALLGIMILVVLAEGAASWMQDFAYSGWFLWCLLLIFLVRIDHPPVLKEEPLTSRQKALGVLSIIVFVLCFSFKPLYVI